MEYAILFAALLAGAAVMFLKGLWDQHRAQKWNREQLRKSFGKAGRTEYADGELNGIVRYFEKHPRLLRVGIAYEFQIVDHIPTEVTDIPLQWIVTPDRTIKTTKS